MPEHFPRSHRDEDERRSAKKGRGRKGAREAKRSAGAVVEELGAVSAPREAPPAEVRPQKSEAPAEPAAAPARRSERAGAGAFNPNAYSQDVEKTYRELGETLRQAGIKPERMPADAWQYANTIVDTVKELSRAYKKESDRAKRKSIAERMELLGAKLSGTVSKEIKQAAEKFRQQKPNPRRGAFSKQEVESIIGETLDRIPDTGLGGEVSAEPAPAPAPEGADASVPEQAPEISAEAKALEVQEQQAIDERIEAAHAAAPEPAAQPAPEPAPETPEPMPAVFRSNRGRPKAETPAPAAPAAEPSPEEALEEVSPNSRRAHYRKVEAEEKEKKQKKKEAARAEEEADIPPAVFRSNRGRAKKAETKPVPNEEVAASLSGPPEWKEPTLDLEALAAMPAHEASAERTPTEARSILGKLIEGYKQTLKKTGEKAEWWKSSEEHLVRRNAELDAQGEKIGGKLKIERGFRWMGEKYNKLPFSAKLAVGAALGLGTVATAGTLAVAFPLLGIAVQRAAGLSTMYLKYEKNLHQEKWGKEKAMLKAGIYTVLMGVAIKEAVELASETETAHWAQEKVEGWLGTMLGHPASAPSAPAAPAETPAPAGAGAPAPVPAPAPETAPAAVPNASEAAAPAAGAAELGKLVEVPPGAMPEVSVEATAGRGYEYMMKRLWEGLQEKGLDASQYAENSDMHKLLAATPENIDAVVHQIAADPAHGFFNADGTSVRIDLGSQMTIGSDGNILLNESVQAPAGAPVTPVYPPEMPTAPEPAPALEASGPAESLSRSLAPEASAPLAHETITSPEPVQTVDLTQEQDLASQQAEAAARAAAEQTGVITNQFGLAIPVGETHVYADEQAAQTFVFGGSAAEQAKAIQEHLINNPKSVVLGTDNSGTYRIPYTLGPDGTMVPGQPLRTGGFLGFFSSWMPAPGIEEFAKLIK